MLHLRIISGSSRGQSVSLEERNLPITIGRDPENRVRLDNTGVSRFHCRIVSEGIGYFIEDLDSTNGTFLNGRSVRRERLSPGDEIIVGNTGLILEATPSSIHNSFRPLDVSVTIDSQPRSGTSLTVTDAAEMLVTNEFGDAFASTDPDRARSALEIMYRADRALCDIEDLRVLLENLLELVMGTIPATRAYIFLLEPATDTLVPYVRYPQGESAPDSELVVSQTILKTAVREQSSIISDDALVDERFVHSQSVADIAVRSAMCVPLVNRNKTLGIVYMDSNDQASVFSRDDLALLTAMGVKAAVAIDNARLYDDLRSLFYNTVETLVRTIQAKDQYTSGHSTRVSRYALLVGEKLGLSTKEKHALYLASMLHDIGKIGVPDDLLNHPGKLSEDEMERVRSHVQLGASMLEMLGEMHPIVPLIRHHHESWDGSGYPDGLKGEDIPLISRIVSVADMYDAMTSDRPYRERRTQQFAVDEIKRVRGVKIDPRIADAFLEVLQEIAPHPDQEMAERPI